MLAVLGVLVAVAGARAQETYTIKLKDRGEGEAAFLKKTEMTVTTVKVVPDANGQLLVDMKETKGDSAEFKETILKGEPGKSPTKVQRDYTDVRTTNDKETEDGPLKGMTVIIEKTKDAYTFTNKNGEKIEGAAEKALIKEFSRKDEDNKELERLVLPKGPVKVGDTWKIDVAKIVAILAKDGAVEIDAAKSTGSGTLAKAYKKDGRQFGDMKFKLEMPLQTAGKGKEQLKFNAGAKILMDIDLDACIDGTSENGTMSMKMIMSGNANVPGGCGDIERVVMDARQVAQDVPKSKHFNRKPRARYSSLGFSIIQGPHSCATSLVPPVAFIALLFAQDQPRPLYADLVVLNTKIWTVNRRPKPKRLRS